MEKHFRAGLCSGRTFTTAVHNKGSLMTALWQSSKKQRRILNTDFGNYENRILNDLRHGGS